MASSMRKMLLVGCRRAVTSTSSLRSFSSRSSLPDGFRSPQAVADAVAAALASENDADSAARRSKSHSPADPNQTAKLERRHLEGDVIATKSITAQQLLHPKSTPDWQLIKPEHFEKVPTPKGWKKGLQQLQERIGVQFQDVALLQSALTHHGCLPSNPVPEDVPVVRLSNRCLEFLGDSLIGAAAAGYVFQMLPRHQEGQLSRAKSALVNNDTLSKISEDMGITDLLLWPPGFSKASAAPVIVKGRVTIAAGAVESLIAAIYLDQGMETAMDFVATHILPRSVEYATREVIWEPIVELQNLLQGHYYGQPTYKYLRAPANASEYTVELYVKGRPILKASAPSYKLARGRAAEAAYWHFEKLLGPAP
ncbi:Ribonuclease 3 [Phytophthora ramorum]|uniref:Ribonuclease 3 n=1 Tax=Phytophthora ramorum TaxID=164328 RepID=UPI003095D3C1|nr:Ribonuclease 3 [Phytophthora ramorum]